MSHSYDSHSCDSHSDSMRMYKAIFPWYKLLSIFLFTVLCLTLSPQAQAKKKGTCGIAPVSKYFATHGELEWMEQAPQANDPQAPIVIALHGAGGSMQRFARRFKGFPSTWRVIYVSAPYRRGGGFGWYRFHCRQRLQDLETAIHALDRLAQRLLKRYPQAKLLNIFGFSQGAVMTLKAVETSPHLYQSATAISGFWFSASPPRVLPQSNHKPHVMIMHSPSDKIIAIRRAKKSVQVMQKAGFAPVFITYKGGHTLPSKIKRLLYDHLNKINAQHTSK